MGVGEKEVEFRVGFEHEKNFSSVGEMEIRWYYGITVSSQNSYIET